jgi:hypothetical protein
MQALAAKDALNSQHQQLVSQTTVNSDPAPSSPFHESQGSQEQRPGNFEPKFVSLLLDMQASDYQKKVTLDLEKPEEELDTLSGNSSVRQTSDAPAVQSEGTSKILTLLRKD